MKTVSKIEVEILKIAKALQKIEDLRPTAEFNLLAGRLAELSTLKTSHKTASKILINIEKKCPGIVRFLQSVAGAGHRYLEFETIEMAARAEIGTSEGDIFKRINQLFYRYDYGWADPRSKMITTLLKCILGQEIDSTFRFFVCSQSGLPLAGLYLRIFSGATVTYLDSDIESVFKARKAIRLLEKNGIISKSSLSVELCRPDDLERKMKNGEITPDKTVFIVNTPVLPKSLWLNAINKISCSAVLAIAPEGLGELSYEKLDLSDLNRSLSKKLRYKIIPLGYDMKALTGVKTLKWGCAESSMSTYVYINSSKLPPLKALKDLLS